MLVISAYLLYTIYEADYDIRRESSFYNDLALPFDAGEREIKSRFRRLAAMHHPDKAGSADSTSYFMHLKLASDTLQNSAARFAYERFGPGVVGWQKCVTIKDYVTKGVYVWVVPHYVVAAATIYVLGLFGYMELGKFYRWLLLLTLLTFELHLVSRPNFPAILTGFNAVLSRLTTHPPLVPFQVIAMARRLTVTIYIALTQLGPLVQMHFMGDLQKPIEEESKALREGLERGEILSRQLNEDAARLMDMDLAPYKGDAEATSNLKGKIREWLVQNTIRADPMVRDALGTSFRKRRIDVPSGAKGNR